MMKLKPQHYQEWSNSKVAAEIIEANVQSLDNAYGRLLYADKLPRRNDGRLSDGILTQYRHLEAGGWYCAGLDAVTLEDSQWGCFKPDRPRLSQEGKVIKYEHPPKIATEAFCLKVSRHQWRQIAKKAGLDCPDLEPIPNEQIAPSFWQWVKDNPTVPVIITEGAKKTASLLSHGYTALGLPGIYSGYRAKDANGIELANKLLIPQLEAFCQEGREFIFCFDNDDKPTTRKNVRTAIANTGHLIKSQGCKVTVMTWIGSAKGIDDLIVANGETSLDRIYSARQSLEAYKLTEFTDLTSFISQTVDSRYLDRDILAQISSRLVGLMAPKGTGKTEALTQQVQKAIAEGTPVIVLTHREQLAKELAARFKLPYRSELEFGAEAFNGYVLCVDSLHPNAKPAFNPDRYPGALVIMDEAEQVIWHLLNSVTCQHNRTAILHTLTELLNGANQIILSDADLTRVSLDYINGLLTTKAPPWVVVNNYKSIVLRKAFLYLNPEGLFSDMVECLHKGERLMVHTGGQKVSSQWGTINLEAALSEAFPNLKILRIDAESVAEPGHPAYGVMGNLNAVIPLYDIVIASPTLETGVSIDVKGHFNRVFCFAPGSQTVEAVCQSLARVREDIPRHIWIKPYSNQAIGNGSTNPFLLAESQHKLYQANAFLLGKAQTIANLRGHSPQHLVTWARYSAIHNHGFKKYRDVILSRLEAEGYRIISTEPPDDTDSIGELMKTYTEANYQKHCEKVAAAPLLDDLAFDRVTKARSKSEPERLSEQKTAISKKYLMDDPEITPEIVAQDDKGFYGQLQLRYYLTMGRQFLVDRDTHRVKKLTKQTGNAFTPDVNSACYSAKIKALEIINIGQFLDGSAHTSESLRDWFETICKFRHDIKTILNQSINPERDTPIGVAQRLLGSLGLKMTGKQYRIKGVKGGRQRIYALVDPPPDDLALTIMERWFERDSHRVVCHISPLKELSKDLVS